MSPSIKIITSKEFSTAFALRPTSFSWFLGAGASASSGIATGYTMIRDFKTQLFCRETGYSYKEIDSSDPIWVDRIDDFFKRSPILNSSRSLNEYATAFEAIYPSEEMRRQYIDNAVRRGTPSYAYRVMASLMAAGHLNRAFTTNFDTLIEQSLTLANSELGGDVRRPPTVAALDCTERAHRSLEQEDWPLIAKLHGDYKSSSLKNTDSELEKQDSVLCEALTTSCSRYGLVIIGYSGRDASIMEALKSTLRAESAFPNGLYWVTHSKATLLSEVKTFLEEATLAGVDTFIVESQNFDELAADIFSQIKLPAELDTFVSKSVSPNRLMLAPLQSIEVKAFPVLRLSALPLLKIPSSARRIHLRNNADTTTVRTLLREKNCRALVAGIGPDLAVFGRDDEVLDALSTLSPTLAGEIELTPDENSWAHGLMYDALLSALSRRRPLRTRLRRSGHSLVVRDFSACDDKAYQQRGEQELSQLRKAYEDSLIGLVPGTPYQFHEGINVRLEAIEGKWWCGFEPSTFIQYPRPSYKDGVLIPIEFEGIAEAWRRERWVRKYNKNWANIVDAWARLLTHSNSSASSLKALDIEEGGGVNAAFTLGEITAFSRPSHHHDYFERKK